MSHWQTGKLELNCSLNILRKALINIMPEWEKHIKVDEKGELQVSYHGRSVKKTYQIVVQGSNSRIKGLGSDIGLSRNESGSWEIGGDYSINTLKSKLTGEVMRMRAIAIAQMRGYEIIKNENNGDEIITDIRIDEDKAKELLV